MKLWLMRLATALAVAFLIFTLINASWLAPEPKGSVKLIAHRGLAQEFPREGAEHDTCTATRIEEPYHPYLENTAEGTLRAFKFGVPMVEVGIAPTADGEIVLFDDRTLDCRTDGSGLLREKTLAQLKAVDIGYGYTADGGETYPFRGKGVGAMPSLEEMLAILPRRARLLYDLKSGDPAEADLLAGKLAAAGRDPVEARDAFHGHADSVARIRELYPEAWAWSAEGTKACTRDYLLLGWSGYLPQSCRGGTMVVPLNYQFPFWGWPNRLIARMEAHGGRVIMTGDYSSDQPHIGLMLPEQFGEVPSSFNGYLWVDDAYALTPALHSRFDNRTQEEIDATVAALERRRAAQ